VLAKLWGGWPFEPVSYQSVTSQLFFATVIDSNVESGKDPYFCLFRPWKSQRKSGWDYVQEIDSRIGFRRESTIEISLRLSSRLFGLQNSDYIRLNGKKCAKKRHERKKSERIFPAIQNLLSGRPGNSLFPAAREAPPG
jgi:hypothetical protein